MRASITSLPLPSLHSLLFLPFPFPSLRGGKGEGREGEGGAPEARARATHRLLPRSSSRRRSVRRPAWWSRRGGRNVCRRKATDPSSLVFQWTRVGFRSDTLHRGLRRDFVEQHRAVGDVQHPRRGPPRDAFRFLLLLAVGLQDGVHLGPQADELGDGMTIIFVLHLAEDLLVDDAEGLVRLGIVAGVVIIEVRGHVRVHVRRFQAVDQAVGVGH